MANYTNSLGALANIAREAVGVTKLIPGVSIKTLIGSGLYNVYPLYSASGNVLMYITAYQTTSSSSASVGGSNPACIVAVDMAESTEGVTLTVKGVVTTLAMESVVQSIANAVGLKQTGPAIYGTSEEVPSVLDLSDNTVSSAKSKMRKAKANDYGNIITDPAGAVLNLFDIIGERDPVFDVANQTGQALGTWASQAMKSLLGWDDYTIDDNPTHSSHTTGFSRSTGRTPVVVAPDDDSNVKVYAPTNLMDWVLDKFRTLGMWTEKVSGLLSYFSNESDFTGHISSVAALKQCIIYGYDIMVNYSGADGAVDGRTVNYVFPVSEGSAYLYSKIFDECYSRYPQFFVNKNYFTGDIRGTYRPGGDSAIEFNLYAYSGFGFSCRFGISCNSNYGCSLVANYNKENVSESTRDYLKVLVTFSEVDGNFVIKSDYVFSYRTQSWGDLKPTIFNVRYPWYSGEDGYYYVQSGNRPVWGYAGTTRQVSFVTQDPTVVAPINEGDTIQNTYNNWYTTNNKTIQGGDTTNITNNYYVTLTPTAPVYDPVSQPSSSDTQAGTIVYNDNSVYNYDNSVINNYVIYNIVQGQGDNNPDGDVKTDDDTNIAGADIGTIETPVAPEFIVNQGNFYNIYLMSAAQINELNEFLWSPSILDNIIKFFSNPVQAILSFGMIFCDVSLLDSDAYTSTSKINIGNMTFNLTSGNVFRLDKQMATVNCGQLEIRHTFRDARDYEPFTTISAYLPFVGEVQWSTSEVMDSTVSVSYNFDFVTGQGLCIVTVKKSNGSSCPLYMYECNCLTSIPLAQSDFSRIYGAIGSALIGVSTGLVGLGAGAAIDVGKSGVVTAAEQQSIDNTIAAAGVSAAGTVATNLGNILGNSTIPVAQSGHVGNIAGAFGPKKPFIIVRRRADCMPTGYRNIQGYPSHEMVYLSNLSGYTVVKEVHVEGISATKNELVMIENLLKEGVIL